jgi:2-polyprenyl-3-methyl-5-hydroxy-6-metoxy-1,4-benzoquinol methylase
MSDAAAEAHWPSNGLERVAHCPICGADRRGVLYERLRDRTFFCAPGEWTLYRCEQCGSGYLDPRPTPETVGLAYARYFTHTKKERKRNEELSLLGRLRRALAEGYRNDRFGTRRQPALRIGAWLAYLLPGWRSRMEAQVRHLPRARPGDALLDIGCGDGAFLEFALEMGWKAEGIEMDPQAVEVARRRGLTVHQGSVDSLRDRKESYEVITLSHVIEHVHQPLQLLQACLRLLKPGGVLWLETPNLDAAGHTRYGRDWRGLEPPRHLVLFTWASLRLLLKAAGFASAVPLPARPMAVDTFPPSEAIRRGEDPVSNPCKTLSVRWHAWRADRSSNLAQREYITISAGRAR